MDPGWWVHHSEPIADIQLFLSAFEDVPDPRAGNTRHDLGELLVIAFVSVLCGATSCAEMAAFGRAKESVFRDFLKLRHAVPSHDTFSAVFRMIDPKALDAAFGRVLADVAALLREGDVIAVDGKALRGARNAGESARTRMQASITKAASATTAQAPQGRGRRGRRNPRQRIPTLRTPTTTQSQKLKVTVQQTGQYAVAPSFFTKSRCAASTWEKSVLRCKCWPTVLELSDGASTVSGGGCRYATPA